GRGMLPGQDDRQPRHDPPRGPQLLDPPGDVVADRPRGRSAVEDAGAGHAFLFLKCAVNPNASPLVRVAVTATWQRFSRASSVLVPRRPSGCSPGRRTISPSRIAARIRSMFGGGGRSPIANADTIVG